MQRSESFVYLQNETLIEEKKKDIYRKQFPSCFINSCMNEWLLLCVWVWAFERAVQNHAEGARRYHEGQKVMSCHADNCVSLRLHACGWLCVPLLCHVTRASVNAGVHVCSTVQASPCGGPMGPLWQPAVITDLRSDSFSHRVLEADSYQIVTCSKEIVSFDLTWEKKVLGDIKIRPRSFWRAYLVWETFLDSGF